MSGVEVSVKGVRMPPWAGRMAAFATKAQRRITRKGMEISLLLCDDGFMRDLNRRYRGRDRPTDVLSFRQADGEESMPEAGGRVAGDIVISLETMRRNALAGGRDMEEELKRLLVHGLLHLSGMDHAEGDDPDQPAGEMLARQERLLAGLRKEKIL